MGFFSSALHRSSLERSFLSIVREKKKLQVKRRFEVCIDWNDNSLVCALGFELATENRRCRIS